MDLILLSHQTFFGAVAAAGFGVLFNVPLRQLGWCAASGAVALSARTICQNFGASLVGASFAAALSVGVAAHLRWGRTEISQDLLSVVGCIPLVPGSLAASALLALFALTRAPVVSDPQVLADAVQGTLRVLFTIGAIGTGLVIPMLAARGRAQR